MGGGSGGNSATQEFKPPSWTTSYGAAGQGPWQDYAQKAINASNAIGQYDPYPGQTIADITPEQQAGLSLTTRTAMNSSPDVLAARGNIQDTAGGRYLTGDQSNPYLHHGFVNSVISDNAANMVQAHRQGGAAQLDAAAARAGAFGGAGHNQLIAQSQGALDQSIGQMANQYRLGAQGLQSAGWQNERANMMQASGAAPQLQNMDLQAGQALTGVGDVYRSYNQDLLNAGLSDWNARKQAPLQGLDVLGNALARASGNVAGGSSTTMTNGYQASPYASLLGLGALGYGLYGMQ
jgi:hypothetical protein